MRMQKSLGWTVGVLVMVLGVFALPVRAAEPQRAAAEQAVAWLTAQQSDDGSIGGDAGTTADAVTALVALGRDPNGVTKNGNSLVSYLDTQAAQYSAKSVASAGKLTLALIAAGEDPLQFGGVNLVAQLANSYNAQTGQYGATATDHAFAMLALASAGQTIPPEAIAALEKLQLPDGGWSYDGTAETGSDTNTAALAVQALRAVGQNGASLKEAQAYFGSQQNTDGGFPYSKSSPYGSDSDANSTANVMQALVALGVDPATLQQGGNTPLTALVQFQNDNGALRYQAALPDDNALATAQAVPALMLKAFPLKIANVPHQAAPAAPSASLPSTGGLPAPFALPVLAGLAALLVGMALRRA